ncbi:MAG: hypothetical protein MUF16_01315 [Burkholderiaceae bacterium]|nr:hypothetical protein [Burkholderiaceae bacterium]
MAADPAAAAGIDRVEHGGGRRCQAGVFSTQLISAFSSVSPSALASTGAMDTLPHTPEPPWRTRSSRSAGAAASPW